MTQVRPTRAGADRPPSRWTARPTRDGHPPMSAGNLAKYRGGSWPGRRGRKAGPSIRAQKRTQNDEMVVSRKATALRPNFFVRGATVDPRPASSSPPNCSGPPQHVVRFFVRHLAKTRIPLSNPAASVCKRARLRRFGPVRVICTAPEQAPELGSFRFSDDLSRAWGWPQNFPGLLLASRCARGVAPDGHAAARSRDVSDSKAVGGMRLALLVG